MLRNPKGCRHLSPTTDRKEREREREMEMGSVEQTKKKKRKKRRSFERRLLIDCIDRSLF
jgi:hypothetical protein